MYPLLDLLDRLHSAAQRSDREGFEQFWAELMEYYLADEIDLAKVLNTAHCYMGKVFPPLLVSAIQGGVLEIVDHISANSFELDVNAHYPIKFCYNKTYGSALDRFALENFLILLEPKTEPKLTFSSKEKLKATATPTINCYFTPLSLAIYSRNEEITSHLLLAFKNLVWDEKQHFLYSPFYEAIIQAYYSQDLQFIELLVKKLKLTNKEKRFADYFSCKGVDVLKSEDRKLAQWAHCYFIEKGLRVNNTFSNQPIIQYKNTFTQYNQYNPNGFWNVLSQTECEGKTPVISTQPRSVLRPECRN